MGKQSLQKRTGALDWNELQTVLAVVRAGSLSGAARALGLQHSTVYRRLQAAEARLGVRLFDRARSGWTATAAGLAAAEAAAAMEAAALGAERAVRGADTGLGGSIRMATSELLAERLLLPLLREFLRRHPDITVELDVSNDNVNLTRREADLALRATTQPPEELVGRHLATVGYALFACPSLLRSAGRPPDLRRLPWVGFDEKIAHYQIARWWQQAFPELQPRLRASSIGAVLQAAACGLGAAVLPVWAAAQDARLRQLTMPVAGPAMQLWLLHHPDMRNNARVRALVQHLAEALPAAVQRLETPPAGWVAPCICPATSGKAAGARRRARAA